MAEKPLLTTMLETSARVGSLIVPAASLESYLGRFASQLTVWTHDDIYKISIPGSATGLIHKGRSLLLCSGHQLKGVNLEDVGIMLPDGSSLITSSGSRNFLAADFANETDAYDVAAFKFTEPAVDFPSLTENFFSFDQVPPDTVNTHVLAFIVAGYPSADQKYELEDKNHIGMVRRVVLALPDSQPTDPALLRLKFVEELNFDPDGLSGGPAFVIQWNNRESRVFLGGIVLRAGKTHCNILKSGFIWGFLSSFE